MEKIQKRKVQLQSCIDLLDKISKREYWIECKKAEIKIEHEPYISLQHKNEMHIETHLNDIKKLTKSYKSILRELNVH